MSKRKDRNYPLYPSRPAYATMAALAAGIGEQYGEAPAFSFRRTPTDTTAVTVSYRVFSDALFALARCFLRQGLSGAHCAIVGKLSYEWICAYMALQMIGAVAVPLDRDWTEADLADTFVTADCRFLLCDAELADKRAAILTRAPDAVTMTLAGEDGDVAHLIRAGMEYTDVALPAVDPHALSALVFTSGTTGRGKGVMLSQHAILTDLYNGLLILRPGARAIDALPPHHTYGSNIGILALLWGGVHIYLSSGTRYILREMQAFRPDCMILVPLFIETFYRRVRMSAAEGGREKLLDKTMRCSRRLRRFGLDLRRLLFRRVLSAFGGDLRLIVSGGAPLRQELIDFFEELGITVVNGYGITECAPLIAANRNDFVRAESVGVPLPCMEVRIVTPNETGEGEIAVRGPNVMLGYYRDPCLTAEVMDADGYFYTGDIGRMDADGVLYVTGRSKNLIILANGKNVYPEEIETELSSIPGVSDVVVYEGKSRRGSVHDRIVAEFYADDTALRSAAVSDAEAYFRAAVETYNRTAVPYKKIGLVRVRTEAFPKNTLRKIQRFRLDTTID